MSRKKAMEDMCKQCIFDPMSEGTWRQQVSACTTTTCPLHKMRPKAAPAKVKMASEIINDG